MHPLHNRKHVDATMKSVKEAQGDSVVMWRALDRAMGTTATSYTYAHSSNAFADFFADKIPAIRLKTASAPTPTYAATPTTTLRCINDVQHAHVIEMIGSAPCKHSELDPLPTWLLKQCLHALAPYLTALFNLSLATTIFSSNMK
jgi:hypothetical protein